MKYVERFIAFIDILGFKEIINKSIKNNTIDEIEDFLTKIEEEIKKCFTSIYGGTHSNAGYGLTFFSDCFVISINVLDDGGNPTELDGFISLVQSVIKLSIRYNFVLRGGITKGLIRHTNKVVFGTGFNIAYEIESEIAIYPRIIIDVHCLQFYEYSSMKETLIKDNDGYHFINYFSNSIGGIIDEGINNIISQGLINKSNKIRVKYQWMKEWHTRHLQQC